MRYLIIDKSLSAHCCFGHTVVDTTKPYMIGGEQYVDNDGVLHFESVCECYDREQAELIRDALNASCSEEV